MSDAVLTREEAVKALRDTIYAYLDPPNNLDALEIIAGVLGRMNDDEWESLQHPPRYRKQNGHYTYCKLAYPNLCEPDSSEAWRGDCALNGRCSCKL